MQRSYIDPPERARAVQALLEQLRDKRPQLGLRECALDRSGHDVLVQFELAVGDPCRRLSAATQPARERRRKGDTLGDALAQPFELEPTPLPGGEPDHLARVPRDRAALQLEDRTVLAAERDLGVGH